jgi:predicted dehydrogenase
MAIKRLVLVTLLGSVLTLSACGGPSTEEIEDYDQFVETINADGFTGFAMYIYSPDVDESKDNVFQVFDETSATLTYTNGWEYDQETKDRANDNSGKMDLIHPSDDVVYIEDGEVLEEFEVDGDDIKQEEYEGELQAFVEKYAE